MEVFVPTRQIRHAIPLQVECGQMAVELEALLYLRYLEPPVCRRYSSYPENTAAE